MGLKLYPKKIKLVLAFLYHKKFTMGRDGYWSRSLCIDNLFIP